MTDLIAAMKATWPHLTELGAACQLAYDTKISRDILDLYIDGLRPGPRHAERLEAALAVPAGFDRAGQELAEIAEHRRAEERRIAEDADGDSFDRSAQVAEIAEWRRAEERRIRAEDAGPTLTDAELLREEAAELDESWRAAAVCGLRDSIGGEEYLGQSPAPRLRAMADKMEVSS